MKMKNVSNMFENVRMEHQIEHAFAAAISYQAV